MLPGTEKRARGARSFLGVAADLLSPAFPGTCWSHSGAPARAGAPFSFARIRRPRLGARAESAPPPRMGIARPVRSRAPAPRARRPRRTRSGASRQSTTGRGRIRRLAASAPPSSKRPIGPRKTAARRRRKSRRRNRGRFGFGGSGFANPGIDGLRSTPMCTHDVNRGAAAA